MSVEQSLLYTKEHEWVKIEGKRGIFGITDHAQHALGDITFVDLPKTGTKVSQFKSMMTIESVKAASDVYAPMSGVVTKVNKEVAAHPELVNKAVYTDGWLLEVDISDEKEKAALMSHEAYVKYLGEHS